MRISGVLITGAGCGIGLAMVAAFKAAGARVVARDLTTALLEGAASGAFDLTDPAACRLALERIVLAGGLTSPWNLTSPLPPKMRQRERGIFVFTASINAFSHYGNPASSAAKAGPLAHTRAIATECGRYGIRANAVCPGSVRTTAWEQRLAKDRRVLERLSRLYPWAGSWSRPRSPTRPCFWQVRWRRASPESPCR